MFRYLFLFTLLLGSLLFFQNCGDAFDSSALYSTIETEPSKVLGAGAGTGESFLMEILPEELSVYSENSITYYKMPIGTHVLKIEPRDQPPKIWHYKRYGIDVLDFRVNLTPDRQKGRSEIRVRGADIRFQDSPEDKTYYTSFEIYVPSSYDQHPKTNWNIIWQCPQLGADANNFVRNTSPPLNLQILNQRLYVTTIHDYELGSSANEIINWSRDNEVAHDAKKVWNQSWAGYIKKNAWNKVFMAFRMGRDGRVRIWVNGTRNVDIRQPIGYQTADYPYEEDPIEITEGRVEIKKRCSARFGLYQGYGSNAERKTYRSKILFKSFRIGTNWGQVRWGKK